MYAGEENDPIGNTELTFTTLRIASISSMSRLMNTPIKQSIHPVYYCFSSHALLPPNSKPDTETDFVQAIMTAVKETMGSAV